MLSQYTSSMNQQQRHHRRQHSAPTDIEATNPPESPATYRQAAHYSEASVLSRPMEQLRQFIQEDGQVGNTNTGHLQQHYLQVAQQHCQARPGQQQPHASPTIVSEQQFRTLQHLKLEAELDSLLQASSFSPQVSNQHFVKIERSRSNPEVNNGTLITHTPHDQFGMLNTHVMMLPLEQTYTQNATTMSTDWSLALQRPFTPPHQTDHGYLSGTPYTRTSEPVRYGLLVNPNATIRPSQSLVDTPAQMSRAYHEKNTRSGELEPSEINRPLKKQRSQQQLFPQRDVEYESQTLPSPPRTVPLPSSRHFDVAVMPSTTFENMPKLSFMQTDSASFHDLPESCHSSPRLRSIPESPASCTHQASDVVLPIREQDSTHRRSPSLEVQTEIQYGAWDLALHAPMSPRTMAMTDISLDATIEDTGISAEEVQSFMSEQDQATGKWTCMYPECGKNFGRKENIRSHIQTHLNDRQFKCVHCNKRFVRQHDLKRHAKIHSGVKPYPCRCGNSFARHDALTRHRQRGICDGSYSGVAKKPAKRGRPRKERPEDEEGADKSSKTRKRTTEKSNYASSISGTSESSSQESPRMGHEEVDMRLMPSRATTSPLMQSPEQQPTGFPPSAFSYTPPMSPYSTGMVPSPDKTLSVENTLTPSSLALDEELDHEHGSEGSDMVLVETLQDSPFISPAGSPPELSHSSPPSSTTRLHDMDFLKVFNNGEIGSLRNEPDYDMFGEQLNDAIPASFGSSWNPNTYFELDKDLKGYNPDFDDESLFAD